MTYKNKRRLDILRDYVIGWTLAFLFLCVFRGVGTEELGAIQFTFWASIILSAVLGPMFGTISGLAQIYSEERVYRRIPIQRLLAYRFFYMLVFLILITLVTYFITRHFMGVRMGLIEYTFDGTGSIAMYLYLVVVEVVMAIISQVNMMLGKSKLWDMLRGKFYTPREEQRIFMFLDLQGSTEIAERLGHINYSYFIQDCFNDLGVVVENEAEVYQYVGDEAVLTWQLEDGLRQNNCVNAYFNFKRALEKKQRYYMDKYGYFPFFKAGINSGIVTVAEVGKYKREIAYHGDTINTAARIQQKCNSFERELLLAKEITDLLDKGNIVTEELGSIPLKGKEEQVAICSVRLVV